MLRSDVLRMEDLQPGMELTGTVRNVVDFGAFVDLGVHQDGLVHVSQMSNRFLRHPSEAVQLGDVVTVWVLNVDKEKNRIALTMRRAAARTAAAVSARIKTNKGRDSMAGKISASMMCADLLHLERDIRLLEQCGVEYLHCDVMDGHFVPNWMLFPDLINRIAAVSSLPLDVHLMIDEPARILPSLALRPGDIVSLHAESTHHLQRALAAVRAQGASPALALNPPRRFAWPKKCCQTLICC